MKKTSTSVVAAFLIGSIAHAQDESLKCRLLSKAISDTNYTLPGENGSISAFRDTGICVTEQGKLFDKNFVAVNTAKSDFSEGQYKGFSSYTDEEGNTLLLEFTGAWGTGGNIGEYTVLSGSGKYQGASGTGTIKGMDSPWESTSWFEIEINLVLP